MNLLGMVEAFRNFLEKFKRFFRINLESPGILIMFTPKIVLPEVFLFLT